MPEFQGPHSGYGQGSATGAGTARPKPVRSIPSEFLAELQSAASMIMSREECAALEQELEQLRNSHSIAA